MVIYDKIQYYVNTIFIRGKSKIISLNIKYHKLFLNKDLKLFFCSSQTPWHVNTTTSHHSKV